MGIRHSKVDFRMPLIPPPTILIKYISGLGVCYDCNNAKLLEPDTMLYCTLIVRTKTCPVFRKNYNTVAVLA